MDILLFLKGALLGFCVAAPVGPIGVLCMRRSLSYGLKYGFITGLGAAAADTVYGAVAAFSLSWITDYLVLHQKQFQIWGALIIATLAIYIIKKPIQKSKDRKGKATMFKNFISSFFLTISNPLTLLTFIALFASFDVGTKNQSIFHSLLITIGVMTGASAWWLSLSWGASRMRNILSTNNLKKINNITGAFLLIFAIFAFIKSIYST